MTLTVSVPAEAESELRRSADAAGQDVPQFVEYLLRRAAADAPLSVSAAGGTDAELDAEYERGYTEFPEDPSLVAAMMPHLAVEPENWE